MGLPRGEYRRDIDGLRAAAVAMVVAFHYFPRTAHGGFIGVDVFFVISGFLITSIIARELTAGDFRFADFYARRVRRIFPALAVVLAACLAFGAISLDTDEFKRLGLHVAAGAGFLSNALLQSEAGYFDEEARDFKPLLKGHSIRRRAQARSARFTNLNRCRARIRPPGHSPPRRSRRLMGSTRSASAASKGTAPGKRSRSSTPTTIRTSRPT